jgi:UDP-galactose 4-epimerase (EC 5.1.3.2)
VLEVIAAFERAIGRPIPYDIVERRPGDIACCYVDPSLARDELGWSAAYDLERMVADTWRWQSQNPDGYGARP